MSVSGQKDKGKSKDRVDIPKFLQPFLSQATNIAGGALGGLSGMIGRGGDLTAGFTPAQQAAQQIGTDRAMGDGGYFSTAMDTARGMAGGGALDYVDGSALEALRGMTGGGLDSFGDPAALAALRGTAGGDFLFGGQGFNEAVAASQRAAQPALLSAFGRGGAGSGTGGLARTAIAQSAQDIFARQFAQERQNQLGAANSLMGYGSDDRNRALSAAGLLGEFGNAGANRQLNAAQMLPGLASADINLLMGIGQQQQNLDQARIDNPMNAQLRLLEAALGGLPIQALLGRTQKAKGTSFGFSGDL
jgi:hypothetical protein